MVRLAAGLLVLVIAISGLGAPAPTTEEKADPSKPKLLAKGAGYFIHALRMPAIGEMGQTGQKGGYQIVRTDRETGEMAVLFRSSMEPINPQAHVIRYRSARILGTAHDSERFYLATHGVDGPDYRVLVVWLADGSQIANPKLAGKGLPARIPEETLEAGPLSVADNEVSCYGTTLKFKGKEMTESRSVDK
jgi:hypothetical protein